jgi:hypothetical protein
LLRYNIALDRLVFSATELPDCTVVDIGNIDDTQFASLLRQCAT